MKENFATALAAVLQHEGGYVNDPQDPGGATNKGVTQSVYDDWRRSQGLNPRSVRSLEQSEVEAIYRKLYWNAVRGDDLPAGVDYCMFDFAVNSGWPRAVRFLQRAVGVADDGIFGPLTMAAVKAVPPCEIIARVCATRLTFLQTLPTFVRFGRGWSRRVAEVQTTAVEMA